MTRGTLEQILFILGGGGGIKLLWDVFNWRTRRRQQTLADDKNEFDTIKSALDGVRRMMVEDTERIKLITDQLTKAMIEISSLKSLLAERDREIKNLRDELADAKR